MRRHAAGAFSTRPPTSGVKVSRFSTPDPRSGRKAGIKRQGRRQVAEYGCPGIRGGKNDRCCGSPCRDRGHEGWCGDDQHQGTRIAAYPFDAKACLRYPKNVTGASRLSCCCVASNSTTTCKSWSAAAFSFSSRWACKRWNFFWIYVS